MRDIPRVRTMSTVEGKTGVRSPKEIRTFVNIVKEHNREPGVFNYNYP